MLKTSSKYVAIKKKINKINGKIYANEFLPKKNKLFRTKSLKMYILSKCIFCFEDV